MTEEIKFEKAMERLEKIVEDLESGNLSLEDALKKYEEGVKLSRVCQDRLTSAEKKIEILSRSLDGSLKAEPFDPEDFEERAETPKPAKSKAKPAPKTPAPSDEEDSLF